MEVAAAGWLTARCAGKAKYFSSVDNFFRGQEEMYRTGDARKLINETGARAGLTVAQIDACLADQDAIKALNDRVQRYVEKDQVHGTPTFKINGKPLPDTGHEVTLADLDAAIAPLLKPTGRR